MKREFHYRWECLLKSSPAALWPLVSDTNRFDRDSGLSPVERTRKPAADGSHRVRTKISGLTIEWDEFPFEWVSPHRFGVVREYLRGPIKHLRLLAELLPDGAGTRLIYQLWVEPRNLLGSFIIPLQAGFLLKNKFIKTFHHYDQLAALAQAVVEPSKPPRLTPGAGARMEAARATLVELGTSPQLAGHLAQAIRGADEMDLVRMRPYVFADRWKVPRRDVLECFLRATRVGLLDLQWDLICPMCRGAQSSASLGGVRQRVHCESCQIDFTANFERSVELTFRPNPAVREIDVREYCIGGPGVTPHVVAQQFLKPGVERELSPILERGSYRLRAGAIGGGALFLVAEDGAGAHTFRAEADGWPDAEPRLSPAPTLRLVNATDREQVFVLERMAWNDQATTAAEVTALQVFRDLFASEALRPGEEISVGSLAVLFTDLRDSTRLYREIGDAPAFGRVMSHFDVLREAIAAEEGALVKTIGDAVMAVFRRPAGALHAILIAQRKLRESSGAPLTLKAGIHFGPCIAVTLNERLDYFGSTVNFASRVQRFSEGGDVVISEAVRADHEVADFLRNESLRAEPFAASIKGYHEDQRFDLWRIVEK